jgi:hypothetical protein
VYALTRKRWRGFAHDFRNKRDHFGPASIRFADIALVSVHEDSAVLGATPHELARLLTIARSKIDGSLFA